jgi:exodeoxyribonuclease VII large subunit
MTTPKNVDILGLEGPDSLGAPVSAPGLTPNTAAMRDCMTVSQLVQAVSNQLARNFPLVRVAGEISGATRAASGHWYFTLKDVASSVRCVLFKHRALLVGLVRNGDQVEIRARAGLYEPRGEFQLVVDSVQAAGRGDLLAAFAALRDKLAAQGLFDPARKRALPVFAARVGIVTSRDAAALRDVATTLARRAPYAWVVLYPAAVQGTNAPRELLAAVQTASARREVDVLILCRGGGSLEDLAAFNDEALAHAIAASPMPVISGVGHETDFSISDFVADVRAPTPTAAAELAARATDAWCSQLAALHHRLAAALQEALNRCGQRLDRAGARLAHPGQRLATQRAELALLRQRLQAQQRSQLLHAQARLAQLQLRHRAARLDPQALLMQAAGHLAQLRTHMGQIVQASGYSLQALALRLQALSPEQVLARGYTFVADAQGTPITSSTHTQIGQALSLHWHDGARQVKIEK